jgi:hypothetical protein
MQIDILRCIKDSRVKIFINILIKMGVGMSRNVARITTEAISKVASNIIQKQSLNTDQSQIISIRGGKGDVVIANNTMNQKVTVNMKALLNALTTTKAQQDLSAELAQKAKSVASGINLFNFTDANNEMDTYMKAAIDISTNISQECAANTQQNQVIQVDSRNGKIVIEGNKMDQMTKLFSKCVENATSNNETLQKIQAKLDQSATAKAEGFSIWALVALAIVALLFLLSPIILAGSTVVRVISKFMFPLMMLAGIIMVALYFSSKKMVMSGYSFSKLLSNMQPCGAVPSGTAVTTYNSSGAASEACRNNSSCQAMDWQGMTIDADGNATLLDKPMTTFYSSVAHSPCSNIVDHRDNLKIMRVPNIVISTKKVNSATAANFKKLSIGGKAPMGGDIWIDYTNSHWYTWDNKRSAFSDNNLAKNPLIDKFDGTKHKLVFSPDQLPPVKDYNDGDVVITWADKNTSYYFNVYTAKSGTGVKVWDGPEHLNVPGKVPYVPTNDKNQNFLNSTAFKEKVHTMSTAIMWIGFGLIGVGLFGTVYTFMIQPASDKKVVPKKVVPKKV